VSRNPPVDLLRGFAILMVVVHHLALPFRLPLGPSLLGGIFPRRLINAVSFNGYESVFVFFVISGFVITRRVYERHGNLNRIDVRLFYRLRAARILPLLLVLLAVLAVLHLLVVPDYVVSGPGQSLSGALLSALTMSLNWYEGRTDWLPGAWDVLWSLSIEELFYLAFPVLCLALPGRWLVLALVGLAVSQPWTHAALAGNEIWQEKAYLPGMSAIAVGVLTAMAARRWQPGWLAARGLLLLGFTAIVAVYGWGDKVWHVLHDGTLLLLCVGAAVLLLATGASTRPEPRGLAWLVAMGRHSYEIYLSHMFVVLSLTAAYRQLLGDSMRWSVLVYPPALLVCMALGRWLHRACCEPARTWRTSEALRQPLE
jgi:peptidoglycan/LPS O-acetylase OafA/YrhL